MGAFPTKVAGAGEFAHVEEFRYRAIFGRLSESFAGRGECQAVLACIVYPKRFSRPQILL